MTIEQIIYIMIIFLLSKVIYTVIHDRLLVLRLKFTDVLSIISLIYCLILMSIQF